MFRRVVDLRRLKSVSKTPKFQYESISTDGDQVRPLDPLIPLLSRTAFATFSGASGRQKITRH